MTNWLEVDNNPAAVEIAANGNGNLYQLHSDGTLWLYQGTPITGWQQLDNNPAIIGSQERTNKLSLGTRERLLNALWYPGDMFSSWLPDRPGLFNICIKKVFQNHNLSLS